MFDSSDPSPAAAESAGLFLLTRARDCSVFCSMSSSSETMLAYCWLTVAATPCTAVGILEPDSLLLCCEYPGNSVSHVKTVCKQACQSKSGREHCSGRIDHFEPHVEALSQLFTLMRTLRAASGFKLLWLRLLWCRLGLWVCTCRIKTHCNTHMHLHTSATSC